MKRFANVPFDAANFRVTPGGTAGWTINQPPTINRFRVIGGKLEWQMNLEGYDITAGTGDLEVRIPGGFRALTNFMFGETPRGCIDGVTPFNYLFATKARDEWFKIVRSGVLFTNNQDFLTVSTQVPTTAPGGGKIFMQVGFEVF